MAKELDWSSGVFRGRGMVQCSPSSRP